jgi:RHS repeat-associated protein
VGQVLTRHDYYAFGEEATTSTVDDERMKFTGHERDRCCDGWGKYTDNMHARQYAPLFGRFLSIDPVRGDVDNPQTWNRYAYVLNNPVNLNDPSGAATNCPVLECPQATQGYFDFFFNAYDWISRAISERERGWQRRQLDEWNRLEGPDHKTFEECQAAMHCLAPDDVLLVGGVIGKLPRMHRIGKIAVQEMRSGKNAGWLWGKVTASGGIKAAREQFQRLTGRLPKGPMDTVVLKDKTVVTFREVGGSGHPKVEVTDIVNKTYQKTTFRD